MEAGCSHLQTEVSPTLQGSAGIVTSGLLMLPAGLQDPGGCRALWWGMGLCHAWHSALSTHCCRNVPAFGSENPELR